MTRSVLVVNHFAVPRNSPGGTRHVDLFSRLQGWRYVIVASKLNHLTGKVQVAAPGFAPVSVTAYSTNGMRRIVNWVSFAVSAFAFAVRQRQVDVVYASSPHLLAGLSGWLVASVRRRPFVLEVRDLWPKVLVDMGHMAWDSPIVRFLEWMEAFLYARATRIVVLAAGSRDELEKRGIDSDKIVFIPNGADTANFVPSAPREVLRDRYMFTRFTAVYAGAHGPANGLEFVLDAAADLADRSVDLVLVGGGVAKPALVKAAADRGLDNVRFLDPVPKDEVPDILHAADLGLHVLADVDLFRTAVSPNKLYDYMAAGLPVVTNCPGLVTDLVRLADCGFAVSPTQLAEGIRRAMTVDITQRGENGRDWIKSHQSLEAMAERLSSVLDSVSKR